MNPEKNCYFTIWHEFKWFCTRLGTICEIKYQTDENLTIIEHILKIGKKMHYKIDFY